MKTLGALALAAAIVMPFATSPARAQEPFYQNKRLTFLINFAAGGPSDIEGRLMTRHIGKYLAGNPALIVQNMDGAGGLVGTNYIGEIAPKDGTMVGYLTGASLSYLVARDRQRVDFLTYNFVAFQPATAVYFVRTDTPPGIKSPADIFKASGLVIGGLAVDSAKDLQLRLLADVLGVKFKYVTGYKGNAGARIAFERGEINMFSETVPGYASQIEPNLVAKGLAIPLFYDPGWNGQNYFVPDMIKGFNIPPFHEFYKQVTGKEPSGEKWDIYRKILATDSAMLRMLTFPPGVPAAAVSALREAVRKLNDDPEFAADARKLVNFVPRYVASDDVPQQVIGALKVTDADRQWIADYIKSAPR